MKSLFLLFLLLSTTTLIAQDKGALIEQKEYGTYHIKYHEAYEGEKDEEDIYIEDRNGEKKFIAFRYTKMLVSIYENNIVIHSKGLYSEALSTYGKGEKITGPNWYGYEIPNVKLVIAKTYTKVYSEPEEIDGEDVFMVEETFTNPK
jgi:hypothetical protein